MSVFWMAFFSGAILRGGGSPNRRWYAFSALLLSRSFSSNSKSSSEAGIHRTHSRDRSHPRVLSGGRNEVGSVCAPCVRCTPLSVPSLPGYSQIGNFRPTGSQCAGLQSHLAGCWDGAQSCPWEREGSILSGVAASALGESLVVVTFRRLSWTVARAREGQDDDANLSNYMRNVSLQVGKAR